MRPIDLTRPVVQVRISGILQQACPIVVPAIGYVCITKRFGPGVSKLRVDRFNFRAVNGMEGMLCDCAKTGDKRAYVQFSTIATMRSRTSDVDSLYDTHRLQS